MKLSKLIKMLIQVNVEENRPLEVMKIDGESADTMPVEGYQIEGNTIMLLTGPELLEDDEEYN